MTNKYQSFTFIILIGLEYLVCNAVIELKSKYPNNFIRLIEGTSLFKTKSMSNIHFLIVLISLSLISCNKDCYEINEIKKIKYDISNMDNKRQTSSEYIVSKNNIDFENDNLYHIYNQEYSLSKNSFGIQIIDRNTNRRFVKRNSNEFEEQMRYEDNPFLPIPISTGKKKTIGSFICAEYIIESNYKSNLTFWISEDFPFVYNYHHPIKFPGFVVSKQGYAGQDTIVETIYDLNKIKCTKEFKESIKIVRKLISSK